MNTEHLDVLESNYRASSTIDELQWTRPDFEWLLRLARLGLWAEEKGIPALKAILKKNPGAVNQFEAADMAVEFHMGAHSAIFALPAVGAAPGEGGEGD